MVTQSIAFVYIFLFTDWFILKRFGEKQKPFLLFAVARHFPPLHLDMLTNYNYDFYSSWSKISLAALVSIFWLQAHKSKTFST